MTSFYNLLLAKKENLRNFEGRKVIKLTKLLRTFALSFGFFFCPTQSALKYKSLIKKVFLV